MRYFGGDEASIRALLPKLSFTKDRKSWGVVMRRGTFRIPAEDFALIAAAMKLGS